MKESYSRVCVVSTVYTLLIYLLYSSFEEIKDTLFVIGKGINEEIRKKIPHLEYVDLTDSDSIFHKIISTIKLRKRLNSNYNLKDSSYWGQDSLFHSGTVLGHNKMTVIEDGFSSYYYYEQHFTFKHRLIRFIIHSKIDDTKVYGIGKHCSRLLGTGIGEFKDERKNILELVSIPTMWNNSDSEKRHFILRLFDVSEEELNTYKNKDVILLTQAAWQGKSTEDMIRMYKEMLLPYEASRVLIKRHPREKLDYSVYFPEYEIITKPFPMELFSLVGVKFNVALTYNSTAVFSFPYELEKVIYDNSFIVRQ